MNYQKKWVRIKMFISAIVILGLVGGFACISCIVVGARSEKKI